MQKDRRDEIKLYFLFVKKLDLLSLFISDVGSTHTEISTSNYKKNSEFSLTEIY